MSAGRRLGARGARGSGARFPRGIGARRLRGAPSSALLVLALVTSGCGYRFTAGAPARFERAICVPLLRNDSFEPAFAARVTDALRASLAEQGLLGGGDCRLELVGRVERVASGAGIVGARGVYGSYRITGLLELTLIEGGRTLERLRLSKAEDHLPAGRTAALSDLEVHRGRALDRLAEALARDATDRLRALLEGRPDGR